MLKEIENAEAQQLLETTQDYHLLDVRTPAEYAEGHLQGCHHVDVHHPDFQNLVAALPNDKPWLVYCRSGARSAVATRVLNGMGYDAANVKGGILAWQGIVVKD